MTIKKSTLRPRRSTGAENLPRALAQWFSGEREPDPAPAVSNVSPSRLRELHPHTLSRAEQRALGLPVEDCPSVPWEALVYPDYVLLPERWQMWKAAHPNAKPPAGYEWMDDPTSPRHPPAWLLERARKCARRAK